VTEPTPEEEHQTLRARVIKGATYLVFRQVLGVLLSLIATLYLSRKLGAGEYGLAGGAMAIFAYFLEVFPLGIGTYLVRKEGELDREICDQAFTCLVLTAGLGLIVGQASVPFFQWATGLPGFTPVATVLFCAVPLNVIASFPLALLERALDFRRVALIELYAQVSSNLLAIVLAYFKFGAYAPVLGWCAKELVSCTLLWLTIRSRPRFIWNRPLVREMVGYGSSFSLASWVWQLRYVCNAVLLPRMLGGEAGKVALGYVTVATRFVQQLNFVGVAIRRLSISAFARIGRDIERLSNAHAEAMTLQVFAIGPILLGFGVAGPLIMHIIGKDWSGAFMIFPWVALSAIVDASFVFHSYVLNVLGRNIEVAVFHGVRVGLFAIGAILFLPRFGLVGYGYAEVLTFASYFIIHVFFVREGLKPRYLTTIVSQLAFGIALFFRELWWPLVFAPLVLAFWPKTWTLVGHYWKTLLGKRVTTPST